ncbi:hypothetical protein WH52_04395 [Tenacibaculum holothuriorum]|uniref:Uncharacterized protein n=1 Tax=Tenacibaculum holothuriorum TaxID=1635173 RepID=A0A1Y2PGS3_9FLAO|nr:hypothetical protein [Tenacibaculum holothuriorum]OSY88909.1 hypothetical protein WH52_04395 [Tenacibaculum holothuriorum]
MEKKIVISDEQLQFLSKYLNKKFPNLSPQVKIELMDHLICGFEVKGGDDFYQYLSNEENFIKGFINNEVKNVKKTYGKQTWRQFFSFFTSRELLPITILTLFIIFLISKSISNKNAWLIFVVSTHLIMIVSAIFGMINKKPLRKLDEVKYLGAEIWLPFLMVTLADNLGFKNWLIQNEFIFTGYWFFTFIYGVSAYIVLRRQKKIILTKYKALLN